MDWVDKSATLKEIESKGFKVDETDDYIIVGYNDPGVANVIDFNKISFVSN